MACARASKASRELLDIEHSVTYLHAQPKKQGCFLIQFCDIDARMRQYRYLNVCVSLPCIYSLGEDRGRTHTRSYRVVAHIVILLLPKVD